MNLKQCLSAVVIWLVFLNGSAQAVVTEAVWLGGGGVITNSGTISFNASSASGVDFQISGGTVSIVGGGTVVLGDNANNRLSGNAVTDVLVNKDNTIQGAGQIGVDSMGLDNRGTITADQSTVLIIDPSASGVSNSGILQSTNGALLRLTDGIFTNTGGTIRALNTSTVEVNNATIAGGLLTTEGSGAIRGAVGNNTLSNIRNTGKLLLPNGANFVLIGVITNAGTVELNGGASASDLIVSGGTVTLSGGGAIVLGDHVNSRIYSGAGTNVFVNDDNTITGGGQIGVNNLGLDNRGTIIANQPTQLLIDPIDTLGLINSGTLQVEASCTLLVTGPGFSNFVAATATLTGGTYRVAGIFKFTSANVVNNAATIILDSPTWSIQNHLGADALANLATNTGSFVLQNGAVFRTYANFVNGTSDCALPAAITINGGSLYITNAAGSAALDVRSGTVTVESGVLKCDVLVITNACAHFNRTGGTLDVADLHLADNLDADGDGLLNKWELDNDLDPFSDVGDNGATGDPDGDGQNNLAEQAADTNPKNPGSVLRVTGIVTEGNNVRITWSCVSNHTYRVQTNATPAGTGFADLSPAITVPGGFSSPTTNYPHTGGALLTNLFYRVRLAP